MANRTANMAKINQIQQTEMIRRRAKELGIGAVPRPVPPPPKKGAKRKAPKVPLGPQRVIFNPPGPAPAQPQVPNLLALPKLDMDAYEEWRQLNYPAHAAQRAGSPPSITQQPTGAIPGPAAVPKPNMFGKTPSQQQAAIAAPPPASPNKIIAPRMPFGGAAATHPGRGHKPQDATKPLTAAQKKQIDAADKAQFGTQLGSKIADADKTMLLADRTKADEAAQAKVEKYQREALERGRQRKRDEVSQLTGFEQLARAAEGIPQNTSVFLEGLPAPGGVALPLLLLLVLFLLVLPVKGADGAIHTRAMWLWHVVTGNASLALTAQSTQGTQTNIGLPGISPLGPLGQFGPGLPSLVPGVSSVFNPLGPIGGVYSLGETP